MRTMLTQREKEALDGRYEGFYAVVVPLSDGAFAVYASDLTTESMLIVDDSDDLLLAVNSRANMHERKTPSKGLDYEVSDLSELMNGPKED